MNTTIDLEKEIVRENAAVLAAEQKPLDEQAKLDAEMEKVLAGADAAYREGIMAELGFDYKLADAQRIKDGREKFAALPQNRIMSMEAIRAVCLKYGLRFLPTRFYKGTLDAGIGAKLEEMRSTLGGKLPTWGPDQELLYGNPQSPTGVQAAPKVQCYIAAPSDMFVLQPRPRDPLLFVRLSLGKFFLLHKWGDDLKTTEVRKGEVNDGNWNSPMANREETVQEMYLRLANSSGSIVGISSMGQFWSGAQQALGNNIQLTPGNIGAIWR